MKVMFTKEEYDYILSFWISENSHSGEGYGKVKVNNTDINIRRDVKGRYIDIFNGDLISFLESKFKPIGVSKISSGTCKLTSYKAGDYFAPHTDYQEYTNGTIRRTLVLQLSSSEDYIGGDLIVEGVKQSKNKGSISIFKSNELHEITLIESGTRHSLVVFLFDGDFEIKKSII